MGATCIGVTSAGPNFGVSGETSFLVFNIDAARADEKTLLDTFDGSNICIDHGSNIVLNISGASNAVTGNLFKDVFSIENFGKAEEYSIPLGDSFKNGWDILFEDSVAIRIYEYVTDPQIPFKFYDWGFSATAEDVRLVFASNGHPNAVVTRSDSTARTWTVSGLESPNFSSDPAPRNYPITWTASTDSGNLVIAAPRNIVEGRVFSAEERLQSDQFMEFSFSLKAYPEPITTSEYGRLDAGTFPNPINYL